MLELGAEKSHRCNPRFIQPAALCFLLQTSKSDRPDTRIQPVNIFPGWELTGYEVLSSIRISSFVNDPDATLQTDSRGIYVGLAADCLPLLTRQKKARQM